MSNYYTILLKSLMLISASDYIPVLTYDSAL